MESLLFFDQRVQSIDALSEHSRLRRVNRRNFGNVARMSFNQSSSQTSACLKIPVPHGLLFSSLECILRIGLELPQ